MEETITIKLPKEKYQFLMKTINSHRGLIEKLGVNLLIKQSLIKDMQILRSILGMNKPSL